ncbi:MAG TPA: cell shape-determining protein, partial [Clostridium sp.]|nr:cell shape-determining protein [Clostridium sp.]
TPAAGKIEGGEIVVVNGENFQTGLDVTFGVNTGTVTSFISSKQLYVKVPASSEGIVDVTITNPTGKQFVAKDAYEYLPPVILKPEIKSILPNTGEVQGGELVYIEGSNFVNGSGLQVTIGNNKAEIVNFYDGNKIRIKVPANSTPGKYDVTMVNGDGQIFTITEGYEYLTPPPPLPVKINSLSITSGSTEGGELIYINGENFVNGDNFHVKIGESTAQLMNFYGPTKLRVRVPANSVEGKYDVTVVNGNGEEAKLVQAYEYIAPPPAPLPEIISLSNISGYETGGELIYIEGKNFVSGLTVTIGGVDAPVTYFVSSTKVRVRVPKGVVGMADVVVKNPDGQSSIDAIQYEYLEVLGEITNLSI